MKIWNFHKALRIVFNSVSLLHVELLSYATARLSLEVNYSITILLTINTAFYHK